MKMKATITLTLLSLQTHCVFAQCAGVEGLFRESVLGKRSIQRDSNMCYAFSLSHAFRILTNEFINPLDIAYQFQRYKNPVRKVQYYDMAIGADLEFYDDSFVETLLAWGFCKKELSSEQQKLLSTDDIRDGALKENKSYLSYFNELIESVGKQCQEDRLFTRRVRPLFMPIRDSVGRKVVTPEDGVKAINTFLKRRVPVVFNTSLKVLGKSSGNHSMLIVGSRQQGDSCSYEVLDSLPKSFCAGLSEKYVQEKNCSEGRYWIKEEDLKTHIISLIGFRVR